MTGMMRSWCPGRAGRYGSLLLAGMLTTIEGIYLPVKMAM